MIAFADGLRAVGWGYRRVLGCGWWRRWGEEGILDWWCTEHPDAFSADYPVYVTMEAELGRVYGAGVWDELAANCEARQNGGSTRPDAAPDDPLAPAVSAVDQRNTATQGLP